MSEKAKISIVILGNEEYSKKSLISLILRRDVFAQRRSDVIIETHVNDTYEVTFTPNFYTGSKDIRRLFSSQRHSDMCLLVVEDGFSTSEVWQHIEKLHEITGKPTEEFTVVLPLGCKPEESYLFKFYTWDDLFKSLKNMPEKNKKRPADQPQTPMETDKPQSFFGKVGNLGHGPPLKTRRVQKKFPLTPK
ncbi:GTPase IMAP family member 8-like [Scomber scombrus]|uniref:GTPase IMAP family member 8-like n=1 Tax=Scomber scombrus TaxID=13677 RepID=A0AAV1PPG2_SCOSC